MLNLTKKMVIVKFDKKKEVDFEMNFFYKFNIQSKRNEIMWNGNRMLNLAKKGRRNYETVKFNNQTKRKMKC